MCINNRVTMIVNSTDRVGERRELRKIIQLGDTFRGGHQVTSGLPPVALNADGSIFATYSCEPYGDWRDSDPMYVHLECSE